MTNYQIGDKLAFIKKTSSIPDILNTGVIVKGPFRIDGINHYHIKWDNIRPNHYPGGAEIELISPMKSVKYDYILLS